jgi:hypothetical protein
LSDSGTAPIERRSDLRRTAEGPSLDGAGLLSFRRAFAGRRDDAAAAEPEGPTRTRKGFPNLPEPATRSLLRFLPSRSLVEPLAR